MPVVHLSNNKIVPSNSRVVDVARKSIESIASIQQRKYDNAFLVNGYDCIVYNKMRSGVACSCMSRRKTFTSILQEDGKMPESVMNQMLTCGLEFKINLNPGSRSSSPAEDTFTNRRPQNVSNTLDDIVSTNLSEGLSDTVLDDFIEDEGQFDNNVSFQDSACSICFGTGWEGGYSPLGGSRKILTVKHLADIDGTIEYNKTPFPFYAKSASFNTILPLGTIIIDSVRVLNNNKELGEYSITIDDIEISDLLIKSLSDGRLHRIRVSFKDLTYFTHLEIQTSQIPSVKLEFPKFDFQRLEMSDYTADLSIVTSGRIPSVLPGDIIAECLSQRLFMITSSTPLNDSLRNYYGWDCQARVIQKSERLNLLPRRRTLVDTRTTNMVVDNYTGIRRT